MLTCLGLCSLIKLVLCYRHYPAYMPDYADDSGISKGFLVGLSSLNTLRQVDESCSSFPLFAKHAAHHSLDLAL